MNRTSVPLVFLLWAVSGISVAQIHYIPLRAEPDAIVTKPATTSKLQALDLPFWDDFSYPGPAPDPQYWENSANVFINAGLAKDPPSLNVASFDGLDQNGSPYGEDAAEGPTDVMTTLPINLDGFTISDGVVLSFFYQLAGNGDLPEVKDSIRVDFMDQDSVWRPIWPNSTQDLEVDGNFHQVLLAVNDPDFLHDSFRFRFQSVGRQSGAFDIWNVDYIYLNNNRSLTDDSYPDRTISQPPDNLLKNFYSVPYRHYTNDLLRFPDLRIRNLTINSSNPFRAYAFDFSYSIDVTDTFGVTSYFANSATIGTLESPIGLNTTEETVIRTPLQDFSGITDADSARIRYQLILQAEDNKPIASGGDYDPAKYSPLDFQKNDISVSTYYLTDYYAYDDGSAEVGAGLNSSGDRLAYQYTLNVDQDYITGIDINFPFTGSDPEGKSIELTVWKDNAGMPGAALYKQNVSVTRIPGKNKLVRYEFDRPILVSGTFYVGYRQITQGELAVGLDRNSTSGNKMFFNLDDFWTANTLVHGSLMIRPVFEPVNPELITGVDDLPENSILPYPNPVRSGILYYPGNSEKLSLTDLNGRELPVKIRRFSNGYRLEVSTLPQGIYLLVSQGVDKVRVFRIVVE